MLNASHEGKGMHIPSSQISTIKRNDPISQSDDQSQVFKKRIITYPAPRKMPSYSAVASEIGHAKREYEAQIQAREAFEDVADFEKRVFGKKLKLPPPIDVKPPTSEELSLLRAYGPPSPTKFFDVYNNSTQDSTISEQEQKIQSELASLPFSQKSSTRYQQLNLNIQPKSNSSSQKVRPAVWTLLDEPTILSRSNIQYKPEVSHEKPFYCMSINNNKQGIPSITPGYNEYNKKQNEKFEKTLKYQYISDKINREKQLQKRAQSNIQKMHEKHEKTAKLITDSGQDWPQRLITKEKIRQIQQNQPKPKPISKDDLEALEFLSQRDDQMWQEMKKNEKLLEGSRAENGDKK